MSNLYIVSTPIGNLQDITIRAIKTLFEVPVIFSERREKTLQLLNELKKQYPNLTQEKLPKIISCTEFEEENKIPEILRMLLEGDDVAYVSEAGTPLLSDPGFKLVREALKRDIKVIPIPGVTSITASLSASGLPTDKFLFIGFLPKPQGKREHYLEKLKLSLESLNENNLNPTVIYFESPHRLEESLKSLLSVFGDREIVIARELTKMYEEYLHGTISNLLTNESITNPRGEFVILFNIKA